MCINHNHTTQNAIKTWHLFLLAIGLALVSSYFDIIFLKTLAQILTDNFIKVFKCVSLPIIALSIIVTLANFRDNATTKNIWKRTVYYTAGTTLIAAAVACLLYIIISPGNLSGAQASVPTGVSGGGGSYFTYLAAIIPENILAPFLEHNVMSVLLVSILIGMAISFLPEDKSRSTLTNFFKGVHGMFLILTGWIVKVIPLALFGFIVTTLEQLKNGSDIAGLAKYLIVIVLANVVQGFIVLPLMLYVKNIKPFETMKKALPALSLAFLSKSSTGALPVTMDTAEKKLKVSAPTSRLVLPLCTSINMNGCAAFIFVTVVYLMQNQGIEITYTTMVTWIFISTIAAIGNAGVPMGCFFLSASLLTSMDVPIEILGLILPFYGIIDMIETSLNVWSDMSIAKVVDQTKEAAAG